jgi:superfamily I DNA and/or RNA helicase/very-short-patch-repair endonuclease
MSNSLYLSVFDSADESISSDYETLITALESESKLAASMFENIVRGMIIEEPKNAHPEIERVWDGIPTVDRLIAESPIPVNEEQRKIQIALRTPDCRYIVVQGPPGTGKSHTISAIAFDAILSGRSVLILSDKVEALDVVEDKLAATLAKVRHAEDFPNPILRLGKTSTYPKLISASSLERIKEQDKAQRANGDRLDKETAAVYDTLRANVASTISAYANVQIKDIEALTVLETEVEKLAPDAVARCQDPLTAAQLQEMTRLLESCPADHIPEVTGAITGGAASAQELMANVRQLQLLGQMQTQSVNTSALALFSGLNARHHQQLTTFIVAYENAKWPLFGYLFSRGKARAIDQHVGAALPCVNPLDLHKRVDDLKAVAVALAALRKGAGQLGLSDAQVAATYDLLAANRTMPAHTGEVAAFVEGFERIFPWLWPAADMPIAEKVAIARKCADYAVQWNRISHTINSAPVFDYVGEKSQLEALHASRMSREIDRKFVNFVGENRALAKSIGEVIKAKKQFPTNEFGRFGEAFPCIIAGVREFAQYVPMKEGIFDILVIDEASQVSLAQAFPALLRAKRVVVFGDEKQFSNVKSQQASKERNTTYLTEMDTYFRRHVSSAADRIERLKQFDVKKSVLDFFKLIANTEIMLKKHFRGYQELISFSSQQFYGGQLQAIKVRSKPLTEVLRFHLIEHDGRAEKHRNANSMEAEFILAELRRMVDEGKRQSVGVITPFREQQEALSRLLLNDSYADRFHSQLHLKIMTFDSCQGEERDLIIYSMVATPSHDGLNYIFPTSLDDQRERIEEALKVQRLNVGFSRAKEGMLFVLSKPIEEYKGSAGRAIRHFHSLLTHRAAPTGGPTESPMEKKVLQYVQQTAFYQNNMDHVELQTQFPLGEYLRQLDPSYKHPAYRCDFLLTYNNEGGQIRVIIEYDGFAEHFRNRDKVTAYNYEQFYREEDIERQLIIEGYGYKFLRINRFNLGKDPVETLSNRLFQLIQQASQERPHNSVIDKIREDAEDLSEKSSKVCLKCEKILEVERFFDPALKGGIGRICMSCKRR